jgi:enoyl-CoA hydratase/carnithine racemase
MTSTVTLHTDGALSVITLNRPHRLNAMNDALLRDLHTQLQGAHADPATEVIVLTGAGRAFCAGDDLKEFDAQAASPTAIAESADDIQRVTRAIMGGPKLVIGAVHGYAVGGGFEWMLNCDMVVAAEDLVAFFPEMQLGHFVTGGVTCLLPLAVGYQRAMELIVLGERLSARQLHALGLVNRVVPTGQALPEALALARTVAERSPVATRLLKKALVGQSSALTAALETERQNAMTCFANPDTAARIAASAASQRT